MSGIESRSPDWISGVRFAIELATLRPAWKAAKLANALTTHADEAVAILQAARPELLAAQWRRTMKDSGAAEWRCPLDRPVGTNTHAVVHVSPDRMTIRGRRSTGKMTAYATLADAMHQIMPGIALPKEAAGGWR